jgi:CHAD domain-containing protein
MPKKYKWEVKGLSDDKSLNASAKLVLQQRLKSLISAIKKYFEDESVENLHEVRIALRRLRYVMEIFISCFNQEKFITFYTLVEHLQDLTGAKRDLDVLAENIKNISNSSKDNGVNSFLKEIEAKINLLKQTLKLELMKFTHSKELKEFKKLL